MANQYRIRIVRGDQEFEAEGDKAFVLKMVGRFGGGAANLEDAGQGRKDGRRSGSRTPALASTKQMSVREFIQKADLKKHTDIVLAFGYYLEHNLGKTSFTPADVNNLYYEAKLEPSNTSQAFILNIRRTYMMQDKKSGGEKGGRNAYTLTQSGEQFIEKKLTATAEE